jgi:hypothetical protein
MKVQCSGAKRCRVSTCVHILPHDKEAVERVINRNCGKWLNCGGDKVRCVEVKEK